MNFYKVTFNYGSDLGDEYRYYCAKNLLALVTYLKERQQYIKIISKVKRFPEIFTTITN